MDKYIIIFCTISADDEAVKIAKSLVEKKLAACVNIVSGITSIYKWKGELCSEKEQLMIIKSRDSLFENIKKEIIILHPYELPEIISFRIEDGLKAYLDWISGNTIS